MSTKAIRECLEYMQQLHGHGMMEDAEAELDALEEAARVIDAELSQDPPAKQSQRLRAAMDLLERIAMDARRRKKTRTTKRRTT